jgi:formate/nitrite transporter FocA (FNT family)
MKQWKNRSHVVDYDACSFLSAIVAGWLMGLLNWLINSVKKLNPYFSHFMITGVIGFGGFHHSIVGNIEVFELLHTNTLQF